MSPFDSIISISPSFFSISTMAAAESQGGDEIPSSFDCDFKFNLFYNSGTDGKPKWKSANSSKNPHFGVNPSQMSLTDLKEVCAHIINTKKRFLGTLVLRDTKEPKLLNVKFHCSIARVPKYLPGKNVEMNTEEEYKDWAEEALLSGSNNRQPCVHWKMEKPQDPVAVAEQVSFLCFSSIDFF